MAGAVDHPASGMMVVEVFCALPCLTEDERRVKARSPNPVGVSSSFTYATRDIALEEMSGKELRHGEPK
jgi:hypothetical protein